MRRLSRAARTRGTHAPARKLAAVLLALVCCHSAPRPASAQTPAAKGAANGSVSGRVTTGDGKPVANVAVALSSTEPGPDRTRAALRATTGDDGRYRIAGVAAGRYSVQALAPLYSSPDYQTGPPYNSGKPVAVGAGEAVENVDLTLERGGVITGRVTNQDGKPAIGEHIYLTNAEQTNAGGFDRIALNNLDFDTDDRGIYRLYGVPPGRYLVSVGFFDSGVVMVGLNTPLYRRTFYPDATDPAQAKAVEVTAGGVATDVDITVADAPKLYEARGKIVDGEGKPVAGVGYGYGPVQPGEQMLGGWGSEGTRTDEAGQFVLHNLSPGRYAVFVAADFGSQPLEVYSDPVQFEVADENVEGLVVKVRRAASISGTVVVEGTTDRAVLARITQLNVSASPRRAPGAPPTDQLEVMSFARAQVKPDGTFRLTGLRPGRFMINVYAGGDRGFSLVGVQRAGADASEGIDVGDGEQATGVRLQVGYGTGVIRGQIDLRSDGQSVPLPPGAHVTVFARRAGSASPIASGGQADSRGRFVIEGLLAGEYDLTINVIVPREPGVVLPWMVRQRVSVTDGGESNVTVPIDLNQQTERNP